MHNGQADFFSRSILQLFGRVSWFVRLMLVNSKTFTAEPHLARHRLALSSFSTRGQIQAAEHAPPEAKKYGIVYCFLQSNGRKCLEELTPPSEPSMSSFWKGCPAQGGEIVMIGTAVHGLDIARRVVAATCINGHRHEHPMAVSDRPCCP